jgi:hypothetical protein
MVLLITVCVVVVLLPLMSPVRCQGAIARPPFRGCRRVVVGLLGPCYNHGLQPGRRLVGLLGGSALLQRRVCHACGSPAVFARLADSGKPLLGCSRFPTCKNPVFLTR